MTTMETKQTIQVREVLAGSWEGGILRIVVEGADEDATMVGIEFRWLTARNLAGFLTDLLAKPEAPIQLGDESK